MSDKKLKKEIEESFEKGQYQKSKKDKDKLKEMASETKNRINLRVEPEVKEAFMRMAEKEGIPYQTLINSILKKYVDGQLIDSSYEDLISKVREEIKSLQKGA